MRHAPKSYVIKKLTDNDYNMEWTVYLCNRLYACLSKVPVWPCQFGGFWGQMTHKRKIFENLFQYISRGHGFTWCGQICQKSAIGKLWKSHLVLVTKKLRIRGSRPSPSFCPHLASCAQHFLKVVAPWLVHVYQIWSGSVAVCRHYLQKVDFSDPHIYYNIALTLLCRLSAYTKFCRWTNRKQK